MFSANEEIGEADDVYFGPRIGKMANPVTLTIDNYEGLIIEVSFWDNDVSVSRFQPYEQVC